MSKKVKEWVLIGVMLVFIVFLLLKVIYFKVCIIEVEDNLFVNVCGLDMLMFGVKIIIKGNIIFLIVMFSVLIIVMGIFYSCVGGVIYR